MLKRRIIAGLLGVCLVASIALPSMAVTRLSKVGVGTASTASMGALDILNTKVEIKKTDPAYCREQSDGSCRGKCNNSRNTCTKTSRGFCKCL